MALKLGTLTPTALYLGTTAASAAYLGATQVYSTGVADAYAIGGASPELVAAFTLASDGTTAGEYFRKASSETTFDGLFTHSVSSLTTMFDSTGTLCWDPHNYIGGTTLVTAGYPTSGWYSPVTPTATGVTDFLGGTTAMTITDTYIQIIPTGIPVAGAKYRMSFVMKLGTQPHGVIAACRMKVTGSWEYITFNATTGVPQNVDPDYDDSGMTDLGGGWWYCWADITAVSGTFAMTLRADDVFTATWDGSATFCHPSIRRIDIPMADNPDIPTLAWFVPNTTGAAKYLPRRNAYYYNAAWLKGGLLAESAAATNLLASSQDMDGTGWLTPTATLTDAAATGPDGTASLQNLLDDSASVLQGATARVTASAGTDICASCFVAKDNDETRFPEFFIYDGVNGRAWHLNTKTGASTLRASTGSPTNATINVIDSGDFWRVALTMQVGTGRTAMDFIIRPAAGTVFGTTVNSATGSINAGFVQMETGLIPTSYIPTTGSTVTRAAETLTRNGAASAFGATEVTIAWDTLLTSDGNGSVTFDITPAAGGYLRVYPRNISSTYARYYGAGAIPDDQVVVTQAQGGLIPAGVNQAYAGALGNKANDEIQLVINGNAGTAVSTTTIDDFSGEDMTMLKTEGGMFIRTYREWSTKLPAADLVTAGTAS